jgi:hypothetical protein
MRFLTLGPEGTCHESALKNYLAYHSVSDANITLIGDFFEGLDMVRDGQADYLIQCSAHLDVHLITEKYYNEVLVTDTFIFPTKELVLLEDARIENPQSLGLVKATEGYLGNITYPNIIYEVSKPVIGKNLLLGKYEAGLTYPEYYQQNPGRLRIRKYIGRVLTTWLVYGKKTVFVDSAIGVAPRGFYK